MPRLISGTLSGAVAEAGGVNNGTAGSTATGTATDTDVDNTPNTFQAVAGATANGYFKSMLGPLGLYGRRQQRVRAGAQCRRHATTLHDPTQDGTTQTVTVTINGANDAAVIGGTFSGTAQEAGGANNSVPGFAASGTATDTDVDKNS